MSGLEIDSSFVSKMCELTEERNLLEHDMAQPGFYDNSDTVKTVTKRHSFIMKVLNLFEELSKSKSLYDECESILELDDAKDLHQDAEKEQSAAENHFNAVSASLDELLAPIHEFDDEDVLVEVRAGAGGEEASLFAKELVRMYMIFSDEQGWAYEVIGESLSEQGGYKEVILSIRGDNAYRYMQYEAGGHRVQRVPDTESQGRVHTSLVTVVVLVDQREDSKALVEIDMNDVRVETFRATGPGGQHVNTTDSAVRLVHIPTGIVVQCQDEKNQHKNKEKAMRVLKARVNAIIIAKRKQEEDALRQDQQGSGDRSDRIRTYNYNQNRITDHRIGKSWYSLDRVLEGDISGIISATFKHMRGLKKYPD